MHYSRIWTDKWDFECSLASFVIQSPCFIFSFVKIDLKNDVDILQQQFLKHVKSHFCSFWPCDRICEQPKISYFCPWYFARDNARISLYLSRDFYNLSSFASLIGFQLANLFLYNLHTQKTLISHSTWRIHWKMGL